ncbi:hypothetical protein HK101_003157, partial [Irineochytrium annulatum]
GHLARHSRIHLKIKPFACDFPDCDAKFARNDNLRAHKKTHSTTTRKRRSKSSKKQDEKADDHPSPNAEIDSPSSPISSELQSPPSSAGVDAVSPNSIYDDLFSPAIDNWPKGPLYAEVDAP